VLVVTEPSTTLHFFQTCKAVEIGHTASNQKPCGSIAPLWHPLWHLLLGSAGQGSYTARAFAPEETDIIAHIAKHAFKPGNNFCASLQAWMFLRNTRCTPSSPISSEPRSRRLRFIGMKQFNIHYCFNCLRVSDALWDLFLT
jgi:hypothetical protein